MASKQLLSSFGKSGASSYTTTGVRQGLNELKVDIEDTAHLSKYFQVVEFDPVFTAGKNTISFNGSDLLKDGSEIMIQVLDKDGNSLYIDAPPSEATLVDIANFTAAIHVYQETINGAGKLYLVGTTKRNEIVRWSANISINRTYKNVSRVRFYNAPYMEVRPMLYPVIQNETGSTLTRQVTVSGSFWMEVRDKNGNSLPNPNAAIPADAKVIVWAYDGVSPNNRVDAFNSQMEGASINLKYRIAWTKTQNNPPIYTYKAIDATTTILDVRTTDEIEVDKTLIELGPYAVLSASSHPNYTCSYTSVEYIKQATTIPCTAVWIKDNPGDVGYMELHTNSDVFTSSVVGENVTLKYTLLGLDGNPIPPFNPAVRTNNNYPNPPITSSLTMVTDFTSSRVIHVPPFTHPIRKRVSGNWVYSSYTASFFTGSITVLSASNPYQGYTNSAGSSSLMKKSYVNIVYRNLKTFSGYVSRHKLYARSNIYPGNFELMDDTVIGPSEVLVDPITANKNFSTIGVFANQDHINQHWFASSASLNLYYTDKPMLNAMRINPWQGYEAADGNSYVIVKAGAVGVQNDEIYYPYDSESFDQFSGTGYTSNFIFLARNTLYALQANMIVNKNRTDTAKVMFFLTSSISSIQTEKDYIPEYGLKLGEVIVTDKVTSRIWDINDPRRMFFTPSNDYYGTLVVVPVNCEVLLSNVSMKNYGDSGYSPDTAVVQIPFPINVANEKWTLKSELFDANYNLVYTLEPVVAAFDPSGASLWGNSIVGTGGASGGTGNLTNLTVINNLYLPGISAMNPIHRFLVYNNPTHTPPLSGEGAVAYSPLTDISLVPTNNDGVVTSRDYINVNTYEGSTAYGGRAIAVRYSGSAPGPYGRRVYVETNGTKHTFS